MKWTRAAPKCSVVKCGADQSVKELIPRDNYSYKVSMKEERMYGQALPLYGRGGAKGKGRGRGRGRGKTHATVRRRVESDSEWDPDDEFDERCENFGFTRSEMNDSKPWDDGSVFHIGVHVPFDCHSDTIFAVDRMYWTTHFKMHSNMLRLDPFSLSLIVDRPRTYFLHYRYRMLIFLMSHRIC